MTLEDMVKRGREARRDRIEHRRVLRVEERQLSRQLGRKLTHAEKTSIALKYHHEELRSIWGDLEKRIKPVQPQKAEQPDELKIHLLPFQLESLYWMRQQEKGEWHCGMLAVSCVLEMTYASDDSRFVNRMKWGKTISLISSYL